MPEIRGGAVRHAVVAAMLLLSFGARGSAQQSESEKLYQAACAACHGSDGKGPAPGRKLKVAVPDFTECSFSTREPDPDWLAIVHQGGPVRAFDATMPAFGESLSEDEIQQILDYIRTLCSDARWPRGELNLPRSLFIEKAYPEDEAVSTVAISAEGRGSVVNELVYEKRFGPRSQIELKVPIGITENAVSGWSGGLGDVEIGVKHVLHHSLQRGTILSLGGELKLPTARGAAGLGTRTWIVEPFVAAGKALPGDAFLQLIAKAEVPGDEAKAEREAGFGAVLGKTFTQGRWGRTWTPMAEVLAGRALENGAAVAWDLVPQVQVSLNQRQHVLANIGVRVPLTATSRPTQLHFYVLWDWFDGGLLSGW